MTAEQIVTAPAGTIEDLCAAMGIHIETTPACPSGTIFLVGPPPRREDFETDDEWFAASLRRIVKITAARP